MSVRSLSSVLVLSLFTSLMAGCAPRGPVNVSLRYTPKDELMIDSLAGAALTTKVNVGKITDERGVDPQQIGENVEDSKPIPVRAKGEAVLSMVHQGFFKGLQEAGIEEASDAPMSLRIHIMKLWVSEDNTYNATARFKVEVLRGDALVQTILVEGSAKQFGSSMKGENYREVLSDAVLEAVQNLINSAEFREAFAE